jgi:hypothetical protein
MFLNAAILKRLDRLEERLRRIEQELVAADQLREGLKAKEEELASLSGQALHVVQLLDEARKEIARLKAGGA